MPRRRIGSGSDSDNNNDGKALKPKMLLRTIQPKGRLRRCDPSTESETDYADKSEIVEINPKGKATVMTDREINIELAKQAHSLVTKTNSVGENYQGHPWCAGIKTTQSRSQPICQPY